MSRLYLGTILGMVLAVPVGVGLADLFGWRIVGGGLAALAAVNAAWLLATLPDIKNGPTPSAVSQVRIVRRLDIQLHIACSCLMFTAMFASYGYIAVFLEDALALSTAMTAGILLLFGTAGIVGNGLVSSVVDRHPTAISAVITLTLILATTALALTGPALLEATALIALWGGAHAAGFLACQVRVMAAAPDAKAFAGSLNIAAANAGIAAGALLGGWVVQAYGDAMIGVGTLLAGAPALALALAILRLKLDPAVRLTTAAGQTADGAGCANPASLG